MTVAARLTAELDQAISIARGFYLGDDPGEWSDIDIDFTAEDVAESSGVDCSELKLFLVSERDFEETRDADSPGKRPYRPTSTTTRRVSIGAGSHGRR